MPRCSRRRLHSDQGRPRSPRSDSPAAARRYGPIVPGQLTLYRNPILTRCRGRHQWASVGRHVGGVEQTNGHLWTTLDAGGAEHKERRIALYLLWCPGRQRVVQTLSTGATRLPTTSDATLITFDTRANLSGSVRPATDRWTEPQN